MNIDFKNVNKHYAARTHEKMQEVLMDPNGVGPAIHYYMIRGGKEQKNITRRAIAAEKTFLFIFNFQYLIFTALMFLYFADQLSA